MRLPFLMYLSPLTHFILRMNYYMLSFDLYVTFARNCDHVFKAFVEELISRLRLRRQYNVDGESIIYITQSPFGVIFQNSENNK